MSITPAWTEEDEEELADIKAKLHRAHKSWSAEQELWHDRVRLSRMLILQHPPGRNRLANIGPPPPSLQHEELEDLKRAWLKAEKKKAKAARKEAAKEVAIDDEGYEVPFHSFPKIPPIVCVTQADDDAASPAVKARQSAAPSLWTSGGTPAFEYNDSFPR